MSRQTGLSPRELQIAPSYAGGQTYQTIADRLCIAPSTVRTHLATIYRQTVRPFCENTMRLAQMFTAQRVIALENARMIRAVQAAAS